jgi:hypothetical protein
MNPNERGPAKSDEEAIFGDDHVEVLVDDLFIEEYQVPLTLPPEQPGHARTRGARALRGRTKSLFRGFVALAGLALVTFIVSGRRKEPFLTRTFHRLRFAH